MDIIINGLILDYDWMVNFNSIEDCIVNVDNLKL